MKVKAFVLMCKRTGNLMEGYRISLMDKEDGEPTLVELIPEVEKTWKIGFLEFDGWLVHNPEASPFAFFINKAAADYFEVLGVL